MSLVCTVTYKRMKNLGLPVSFVCRPFENTTYSQVVCCKNCFCVFMIQTNLFSVNMSQKPSKMHLHQFILRWIFPALLGTKSSCLYDNSQTVPVWKKVVGGNLFVLGCCGKSTYPIHMSSVSASNSVTGLIFFFCCMVAH